MVHGTRDVWCTDSLCALTMAACGSTATAFHAPGDEARAEALKQTAEAQQLPVATLAYDLMAEGEPLPIVGREKQYYGDSIGNANLLVFADVLSDIQVMLLLSNKMLEALKV